MTTAWLELGKSAPIGQEFELIVQNDLEFQLTLQMKVDDERFRTPEPAPAASPTKQKASTFSRVFASPRKRKELEMKQQLATQQQKSKDVNGGVWDRLRSLIARDGSFARAYVALSDHEKHAFGRPYTVDIACFNEWAVEEQPSSIKSKKSTASSASQRRPPYKIGKLELQLLFVPRPKGTKDDDMPKSMNACIREMRDAESVSARSYEGFLSQQGGDCPVSCPVVDMPVPSHPNGRFSNFTADFLCDTVLATSFLQAPGVQTYSVPRDHAAASCYNQPVQGCKAYR